MFSSRLELWVRCAAVSAVVRLASVLLVPLLPEETYHWCYSRHPAFGYYDHPPMIAWMIGLGRLLFGDSTLGIRFVPWLASIGTTLALGGVSRRLHGVKAAVWTVFLLSIQPATLMGSSFAFPDSPLLLFWSLALLCLVLALETGQGRWWLGAGAALGAGLLSKYTACFLGASVFGYLVLSRRDRHWLASPWPYLGILLAFATFSPVIYWNATHDWASFRFQSVGRLEASDTPRLRGAFVYLAGQWGGVVPLTLPLTVLGCVVAWRERKREDLLLLALSAPILLFFFAIGWIRATHVFWPLPAHLALTVLTANVVTRSENRIAVFYRTAWKGVLALTSATLVAGILHTSRPLPGVQPLRCVYDWDRIAGRARELHSTLPAESFYLAVGKRYLSAAQLAFRVSDPHTVHAKNLLGEEGLQFTYWADPKVLRGKDAVVVAEADWSPALETRLREHFREITPAGEWIVRGGRKEERYTFYIGRGYIPFAKDHAR